MASLQSRLSSLITAIGADIKALQARTPTILSQPGSLSSTSQPLNALEWWYSLNPSLIAKLAAFNKIENSVILDRTELWARLVSRTGGATVDKMILDSNGLSMLVPPIVTALPTTGPGANSAVADGQECYFVADSTNNVVWHLKYRAATSKWVFVGGPPLLVGPLSQNVGGDTFNNGAGYLATSNTGGSGPNITIPSAGVYDIQLTAYMRHGAAGGSVFYSFQLPNGTAASDADALYITMAAGNAPDIRHSKTVRKTLTAGTLSARYKASGGSSVGLFDERAMSVTPVFLG